MEDSGEIRTSFISGTVSSFDVARGYGYVAQGGGRELFAAPSTLQRDDPHTLAFGAHVVFEVVQGPAGPHVTSVHAY